MVNETGMEKGLSGALELITMVLEYVSAIISQLLKVKFTMAESSGIIVSGPV